MKRIVAILAAFLLIVVPAEVSYFVGRGMGYSNETLALTLSLYIWGLGIACIRTHSKAFAVALSVFLAVSLLLFGDLGLVPDSFAHDNGSAQLYFYSGMGGLLACKVLLFLVGRIMRPA